MNPRIKVITLGVGDLEKSLAFYRDGLGLHPRSTLRPMPLRSAVRYVLARSQARIGAKTMTDKQNFADLTKTRPIQRVELSCAD